MNKLLKPKGNRTGAKISPKNSEKTRKGANKYSPINVGDATALNQIRAQYASEPEYIGTVPPPASLKQGAATIARQLAGKDLTVLVDKLSERIGFEANGTRLYDALIAKCQMVDELPPEMTLADLQHIRDEEHQHLLLLVDTVKELGGDPTVVSPAADASATASSGLCKVVGDPRTTVLQALDAMLIAELTDNDGWALLISVCEGLGLPNIAERFEKALEEEEEHLQKVRTWLSAGVLAEAGNDAPAERPRRKTAKTAVGEKKAADAKPPAKSSTRSTARGKAAAKSRTSSTARGKAAAKSRTSSTTRSKSAASSRTRANGTKSASSKKKTGSSTKKSTRGATSSGRGRSAAQKGKRKRVA